MKALIEAGADVNKTAGDNRTALIIAATQGRASCVVELIKAGAHVCGSTPLLAAILNGHEAIVGMLILAGSDVGKAAHQSRGRVALGKSCKYKSHELENIEKLLEQFGA